jgi:hypothetical protein
MEVGTQVATALRAGAEHRHFSLVVARARAAGVAVGPPCSTATACKTAELTSSLSAAPRRAASSSAVGRPVPPPSDDAPPRHRACAGAWALRSGRLTRWATSRRALGREPARRTGRVRCASQAVQHCANGPRRHCGRGQRVTVPQGRGGFGPVAFELFFYFPNIFKFLQIQKVSESCCYFIYSSLSLIINTLTCHVV